MSTAAARNEGRGLHGNLRSWNSVMALLHSGQGVAMLLLSSAFALPVTASFLAYDPVAGRLEPHPETLFNVWIGPVVASFLFVSALAHGLLALPGLHGWYTRNLVRRINYARWAEYSVSSSLMIVVVAMLVGIYDIASLMLIVGMNATMILFGWMMEVHNQTTTRTDWTAFNFGSFAGLVPWIAIAVYLFGSGSEAGGPPGFVYGIFGSIFLFFNVFALNMWLQYRKVGPWRDYLYGERMYIILSLTAKSVLAWQVFIGTLRPV